MKEGDIEVKITLESKVYKYVLSLIGSKTLGTVQTRIKEFNSNFPQTCIIPLIPENTLKS